MRRGDLFAELSVAQLGAARRSSLLGFGLLAAAVAVVAATHFGHGSLTQALATLGRVQPVWLLIAGADFGLALLFTAAAWKAGLRTAGGSASFTQVAARCSVGSLVNSVAPAHLGGAVRIGLLSRTLSGRDPVWRTCGVAAAVGAARTLPLALLIVGAAIAGRVPLWPAPLLVAGLLAALAAGVFVSERVAGRVGILLRSFRDQLRSPRRGLDVVGWTALSLAARLAAAIAVVAALGIAHPFPVALVLLAAIALTGFLPLTPGNIGAGAGAATLALHGTGVGVGVALALGMTFQAIETAASVMLGTTGLAVVSAPGTRLRRWSFATVGMAALLVAASVGVASVDFS